VPDALRLDRWSLASVVLPLPAVPQNAQWWISEKSVLDLRLRGTSDIT
jgi:hypothetical protein